MEVIALRPFTYQLVINIKNLVKFNDYELEGNLDIRYISENRPLGTGGGLLNVLKYIPDDTPFLVMNGDTYFPIKP